MQFSFGRTPSAKAWRDGLISIVVHGAVRIHSSPKATEETGLKTTVIKHCQEIAVNNTLDLADQSGSEQPTGWLMAQKLHAGASPHLSSRMRAGCQNFVRE